MRNEILNIKCTFLSTNMSWIKETWMNNFYLNYRRTCWRRCFRSRTRSSIWPNAPTGTAWSSATAAPWTRRPSSLASSGSASSPGTASTRSRSETTDTTRYYYHTFRTISWERTMFYKKFIISFQKLFFAGQRRIKLELSSVISNNFILFTLHNKLVLYNYTTLPITIRLYL